MKKNFFKNNQAKGLWEIFKQTGNLGVYSAFSKTNIEKNKEVELER